MPGWVYLSAICSYSLKQKLGCCNAACVCSSSVCLSCAQGASVTSGVRQVCPVARGMAAVAAGPTWRDPSVTCGFTNSKFIHDYISHACVLYHQNTVNKTNWICLLILLCLQTSPRSLLPRPPPPEVRDWRGHHAGRAARAVWLQPCWIPRVQLERLCSDVSHPGRNRTVHLLPHELYKNNRIE